MSKQGWQLRVDGGYRAETHTGTGLMAGSYLVLRIVSDAADVELSCLLCVCTVC